MFAKKAGKRVVYLDHIATTPVAEEVLEAMLPYFREHFGNPTSLHSFGQEAKKAVNEAREKLAALIKANTPYKGKHTGRDSVHFGRHRG